MKRRENDKKIIALHVEMKDMMTVLIQYVFTPFSVITRSPIVFPTRLKNVKDPEEIAPDGTTIKGRMEDIIKGTADDIKACANACDTYSKKKLVGKRRY